MSFEIKREWERAKSNGAVKAEYECRSVRPGLRSLDCPDKAIPHEGASAREFESLPVPGALV